MKASRKKMRVVRHDRTEQDGRDGMTERRTFSDKERAALFVAADGRCQLCGEVLEIGWHADHIRPYSKGGATDVANGQALCRDCNLKKGGAVVGLELRQWQSDALTAFGSRDGSSFLVVATPGAGKTAFAGEAIRRSIDDGDTNNLVVVVPTEHLKQQWTAALDGHGIDVTSDLQNKDGIIPKDFAGAVVTYAQVASAPHLFRKLVSQRRTFAVLDEIHHCGRNKTWGDALSWSFEKARVQLALSGTPFRSDNNEIPFVRYVDGQGHADFLYGYSDALSEGICRSVFFRRMGGTAEWTAADGDECSHTFEDDLNERGESERLRSFLSPDGGWLADVLQDANARLSQYREIVPEAGALVVCMNRFHATGVVAALRQIGEDPVIVASDEPDSSARISEFRGSTRRWIVAIKMVSEGVDIPRLRVGVYATNTVTELYFRQFVGRFVRVDGTEDDTAVVFIPDDARIRAFAEQIQIAVEHDLDAELPEESGADRLCPTCGLRPCSCESQSLFEPGESAAADEGTIHDGEEFTPHELALCQAMISSDPTLRNLELVAVAKIVRSVLSGAAGEFPKYPKRERRTASKQDRRKALRTKNNKAVAAIKNQWSGDFNDIHYRLNTAVGVSSITAATEGQLERRLELAKEWRMTGKGPGER